MTDATLSRFSFYNSGNRAENGGFENVPVLPFSLSESENRETPFPGVFPRTGKHTREFSDATRENGVSAVSHRRRRVRGGRRQ